MQRRHTQLQSQQHQLPHTRRRHQQLRTSIPSIATHQQVLRHMHRQQLLYGYSHRKQQRIQHSTHRRLHRHSLHKHSRKFLSQRSRIQSIQSKPIHRQQSRRNHNQRRPRRLLRTTQQLRTNMPPLQCQQLNQTKPQTSNQHQRQLNRIRNQSRKRILQVHVRQQQQRLKRPR